VTVIICCSLNRHLTIVFLWANFAGQTAFVAVFAAAVSNAIGYPKFNSRSHDAVIRVYDDAGNVIETHEHRGDFTSSDCVNPHFAVGSSDRLATQKTRMASS